MSEAAKASGGPNTLQQPIPAWIGAGIIGLVLGAGATLIVMRFIAPSSTLASADGKSAPTSGPSAPGGGGPGSTPMMGMPGMGGGGMGGGGGGGPRGRRNLPSLVGRLELLTRETLHVDLTPEQNAKIAEQLAKMDQAEKMNDEEAQAHLEALEALLSPEQKAIADSISLPFARTGGGGGMGGMGPADDNPFKQEANQKRLHDLLARVKPAGFDSSKKEPTKSEPAQSEPAKTEPAKVELEKSDGADKK